MDSQKDKQQFLFTQIIEKNYDPEQFQDYFTKAKPNGDDLDNWTIDELKDAVGKFQKLFEKDSKEESKEEKKERVQKEQQRQTIQSNLLIDNFIEEDQATEKSGISRGKGEEYDTNFQYFANNQPFHRIMNCTPAPVSSLVNANNLQVLVVKFQKKEGGLFQQSYVSYFINTPFFGKQVERRYSDFEWLKETLQWLHPGIPVPPIAKKGQFRRYDDKHLRKRMMILEMFLNKLLQIPELRAQLVIQNFLKLDDKVSFQKFKANYKKGKKLIPLKNVKTTKGVLNLGFDNKMNVFLYNSQRFLTETQPSVKALYKQFKAAATSMQSCGSILKNIGQRCDALNQVQKKFRKEQSLSFCPNNFYTIVSEAVSRLAQQMINQALIFRTETYSLIKYQSLYMLNILDTYDHLATFQQKYQQTKSVLAKKKVKLFQQGNVQKWELQKKVDKNSKTEAINAMLPKETRKLSKIRDLYGLFNNEMNEQLHRYFNTKNTQLGSHLQAMCRKETRLCSQMMMVWVDAQTNIMGMRQNKSIKKC